MGNGILNMSASADTILGLKVRRFSRGMEEDISMEVE